MPWLANFILEGLENILDQVDELNLLSRILEATGMKPWRCSFCFIVCDGHFVFPCRAVLHFLEIKRTDLICPGQSRRLAFSLPMKKGNQVPQGPNEYSWVSKPKR
jgi:hypothetical protein